MAKYKKIDLHPEEYKAHKRAGLSDKHICILYDTNSTSLNRWKNKHGLIGVRNAKAKKAVEKLFPGKIEKMIRHYKKRRNEYWSDEAIAEEMGISITVLHEFKTEYVPEEKRKTPAKYTEEQKARAKKAGLTMETVMNRIKDGWDEETAYTKPLRKNFFTKEQMDRIHKSGIHRDTVRYRMEKRGYTFEKAVTEPPAPTNGKGKQ